MTTRQFDLTFAVSKWLIGRLHADEELHCALLGGRGDATMHGAMSTLEQEARNLGWTRADIDAALKTLQVN